MARPKKVIDSIESKEIEFNDEIEVVQETIQDDFNALKEDIEANETIQDESIVLVEDVAKVEVLEFDLVDEKGAYEIEVIQATKDLKIGYKTKVSGNVANALLKKGLIKII